MEERPYVLNLITRETGLQQFGKNDAKGCLCERSDKHIGTIYDVVFPGQCPFCHCTTTGQCLVKFCGSYEQMGATHLLRQSMVMIAIKRMSSELATAVTTSPAHLNS
jgi:hypothetical protein